jgi:hypothetical protein
MRVNRHPPTIIVKLKDIFFFSFSGQYGIKKGQNMLQNGLFQLQGMVVGVYTMITQ